MNQCIFINFSRLTSLGDDSIDASVHIDTVGCSVLLAVLHCSALEGARHICNYYPVRR